MSFRYKYILYFVPVFLIFLSSFNNEKEIVEINISGSSTMQSLLSELALKYCLKNPHVAINILGTGSANGLKDLLSGKSEIAMMSRGIKESEKLLSPNSKFELIELARDGVMPVVSKEIFVFIQALTLKQIAQIYNGEIKNWKELNGPDKDIFVIDKVKSSGTRNVYMNALFKSTKIIAQGADTIIETTAQEAQLVRNHDSALGMLSNAWLDDDVKGLSIIMKRKLMRPYKSNIDAGIYPIIRPLNLVITNNSLSDAGRNFLNFIKSKKGQKIIAESGYSVVFD